MNDLKKVEELVNNINSRKTNESIAATYKDSADLKELATIALAIEDKEDLDLAFDVFNYLGEQYESLGRFSVAADYRFKELETAKKINDIFNVKKEELNDLLSITLRDRNFYIDDDCDDVRKLATNLLDKETVDKAFERIFNRRRNLKHDPVEMTPEYLAVIDEVEEKIDKNLKYRGMGACHEIWNLKFQYLLEKGISWKSPSILNPRVMFD